MLYDFDKNQSYEIDLRCLEKEFDKMLSNYPVLAEWVSRWRIVFQKTYKTNNENIDVSYFDKYSLPIKYEKNKFSINFNITKAKQIVKSENLAIEIFDTKDFQSLMLNFELRTVEKRSIAEPIIIVPFGNQFLLIDGNHRLSVALKYNIKQIRYVHIYDTSLIWSLVPSIFERAFYSFIIDKGIVSGMIESCKFFDFNKSLLFEFEDVLSV